MHPRKYLVIYAYTPISLDCCIKKMHNIVHGVCFNNFKNVTICKIQSHKKIFNPVTDFLCRPPNKKYDWQKQLRCILLLQLYFTNKTFDRDSDQAWKSYI